MAGRLSLNSQVRMGAAMAARWPLRVGLSFLTYPVPSAILEDGASLFGERLVTPLLAIGVSGTNDVVELAQRLSWFCVQLLFLHEIVPEHCVEPLPLSVEILLEQRSDAARPGPGMEPSPWPEKSELNAKGCFPSRKEHDREMSPR
jgi:hypothetical protein